VTPAMIRFEEIDGLYCPVFVCHRSGQPIQGGQRGLIQWDNYDEPTGMHLAVGAGAREGLDRLGGIWRSFSVSSITTLGTHSSSPQSVEPMTTAPSSRPA
jgi:hypothetical protein